MSHLQQQKNFHFYNKRFQFKYYKLFPKINFPFCQLLGSTFIKLLKGIVIA